MHATAMRHLSSLRPNGRFLTMIIPARDIGRFHDTQVPASSCHKAAQNVRLHRCRTGARLHTPAFPTAACHPTPSICALNDLIVNKGCRIVVTGADPATVVRPDGTSVWSNIYDHYAEHYDVLFANAAGTAIRPSPSSATVTTASPPADWH